MTEWTVVEHLFHDAGIPEPEAIKYRSEQNAGILYVYLDTQNKDTIKDILQRLPDAKLQHAEARGIGLSAAEIYPYNDGTIVVAGMYRTS
jgi:hypothetical protein